MKKLMALMAVLMLFGIAVAFADSEKTTTLASFNIESVVAFTVTLPSESPVESSGAGEATTAIEFNATSGTVDDVNARVVGGVTQSDGTPIFSIDNIGTVPLNMTIAIDSGMPACMTLNGGLTYPAGTPLTTDAVVISGTLTPSASAVDYYLQTDFTACDASDSTSRTVTISGLGI